MKRTILLIVILALTISLISCSVKANEIPSNALVVNCPLDEITYLLPGDYPAHKAEDAEALKWGYNVFVSKLNHSHDDILVLSGNRNEGLERTSLTYSGTYFKSGEWFGCEEGVFLGSEKIIPEECIGMVASWGNGYAILIITNTEDNSFVYSARFVDEEWVLNKEDKIELGAQTKFIYYHWPVYPSMTHSPSETMYLITESELVTLAVGEYLDFAESFSTVTKVAIKTPEYWQYLSPTSATNLNGKLYIGDMFGVVEYDKNTKVFTYYPIDIRAKM